MMRKSYLLSFFTLTLIIILLITYYNNLQNKIPDVIAKSNETFFNVDQIRFTFKISTISKRALNTYLQALHFKDEEKIDESLEFYNAVIAFTLINYTKDQELIDYVIPRIEHTINTIEKNKLQISDDKLHALIKLHNEINYFVSNQEKSIWAKVKKDYVALMTHQESEKNTYQIVLLFITLLLIIILILFIRSLYLKNENKALLDKFEYAVDNALAGYWEWNLENNYLYLSKGWKNFLGYEEDQLKNNFDTFKQLLHPDDLEATLKSANEYIQNNKDNYTTNFRLKHKNGSYKWVSSIGKIVGKNKKVFFGFHIDIDDITTTKEMLVAQSKSAMLGEMISLIAHQFKQPLSVISLITSNQKVSIEFGEELQTEKIFNDADSIDNQIEYLSSTIDTFRNFLKPNTTKNQSQIEEVIESSLKIMDKSLRNNSIEVITSFSTLNKVDINISEIMQVIINLINNSKDAFKLNNIDNRKLTITTTEDQENITVEIEDNAGGIPKSIITKVFDPYFTTKEMTKGTGLGLYISKIIISERYAGSINVKNTNNGVVFTIVLPIATKEVR